MKIKKYIEHRKYNESIRELKNQVQNFWERSKHAREELEDNLLRLKEVLNCTILFNEDVEKRYGTVCALILIPENFNKIEFLEEFDTMLNRIKNILKGQKIHIHSKRGFRWLLDYDKSLDKETNLKYIKLGFKYNYYMNIGTHLKNEKEDYNYLFNNYKLEEYDYEEWRIDTVDGRHTNLGKIFDMIEIRIND